ncbi:MAG TPA: glycoside hydrolase family 3 N-terminal domain-containing protein [Longimicrobium sp.]|nr:glycoside hydrolase family 3 N-terminal domain-containing protein [Longimicrobium sp.]
MSYADAREFGRHFVVGLRPAAVLADEDKYLLDRLRPAGIVLFAGNFAAGEDYDVWLARHRRLLHDARECLQADQVLVCMDHEGGRVVRPPAPITHFDYARSWAHRAGEVGTAMAVELASLGVNLDFAPVMDVPSNPDDPIIGPRAFATTPEEVAMAGTAFIAALQGGGVLACAKHFPGHGDAGVDSHEALPVIDATLDTLRGRELPPFAAAIQAGVRAVMTAHILIPRMDEDHPATLSERILGGLLRSELGFEGVVFSDDVGMGAVSERFRWTENAARFLVAGGDILTLAGAGTDTSRAIDLARAIAREAVGGQVPERVLDASRERIGALLRDAPQHEVRELGADVFARHAELAPVMEPGRG